MNDNEKARVYVKELTGIDVVGLRQEIERLQVENKILFAKTQARFPCELCGTPSRSTPICYDCAVQVLKDKDTRIERLEAALDQVQAERDAVCVWDVEHSGDDEYWHTSCNNDFVIREGDPEDNEMKYCPYCGKKLETDSVQSARGVLPWQPGDELPEDTIKKARTK